MIALSALLGVSPKSAYAQHAVSLALIGASGSIVHANA
jgi:hypothetical protein